MLAYHHTIYKEICSVGSGTQILLNIPVHCYLLLLSGVLNVLFGRELKINILIAERIRGTLLERGTIRLGKTQLDYLLSCLNSNVLDNGKVYYKLGHVLDFVLLLATFVAG